MARRRFRLDYAGAARYIRLNKINVDSFDRLLQSPKGREVILDKLAGLRKKHKSGTETVEQHTNIRLLNKRIEKRFSVKYKTANAYVKKMREGIENFYQLVQTNEGINVLINYLEQNTGIGRYKNRKSANKNINEFNNNIPTSDDALSSANENINEFNNNIPVSESASSEQEEESEEEYENIDKDGSNYSDSVISSMQEANFVEGDENNNSIATRFKKIGKSIDSFYKKQGIVPIKIFAKTKNKKKEKQKTANAYYKSLKTDLNPKSLNLDNLDDEKSLGSSFSK